MPTRPNSSLGSTPSSEASAQPPSTASSEKSSPSPLPASSSDQQPQTPTSNNEPTQPSSSNTPAQSPAPFASNTPVQSQPDQSLASMPSDSPAKSQPTVTSNTPVQSSVLVASTSPVQSLAESPTSTSNPLVLLTVTPVSVPTLVVVTIGSSSCPANLASGFVINSQILNQGGQITQSSRPISLSSNGGTFVVDRSSQTPVTQLMTIRTAQYLVGSQTLSAGGPAITFSGTVVSLQSNGSSAVIGGSTQSISAFLAPTPEVVIGSRTVTAGASAITVLETAVSLQTGGSSIVIGGSTQPVTTVAGAETTTGSELGGIIATIGGFGSSGISTSTTTYAQYTGPVQSGGGYNGTMVTGGVARRESSLDILRCG